LSVDLTIPSIGIWTLLAKTRSKPDRWKKEFSQETQFVVIVWTSCEVRKPSRRLRFSSYLLRCQTAGNRSFRKSLPRPLGPGEVAAYTAGLFLVNRLFLLFCSSVD
jgi:hypothetical protein